MHQKLFLLTVVTISAVAWPLAGSVHADLLATWDDWADADAASGTSPYAPDSTLSGFSAEIVHSGDSTPAGRINSSFGSTDGTFGTLPGASTTSNPALLVRGFNNELTLTVTLTNNTGQAYTIDSFHFDFAPRQDSAGTNTGPNAFTLTYVSGGLGDAGTVIDSRSDLPRVISGLDGAQADYPDYDYALASYLSDITLADGEQATFTLAFSGQSYEHTSSAVDNVAFTARWFPNRRR